MSSNHFTALSTLENDGGASLLAPAGDLSLSTLQLESSGDDFDLMVKDMRSAFVFWLTKTREKLQAEREEIKKESERLQREKAAFAQRLKIEQDAAKADLESQKARHDAQLSNQLKQIHQEREETRRRIKQEQDSLAHQRQQFENYRQLELQKLKNRLELLELDMQKVNDSQIATQTMIDINVGGVVFETSRHVLMRQPESFLAALISGRHEVGRDRQGRIFLDRDYELFRVILNYLRNPSCIPVPRDTTESSLILSEASYYRIKFSPYPLVVAIGGMDGKEHLKSVEMLDETSQCWRTCRDMATERAHFGAGVVDNFIWAFGGHNLDYRALCETEMYDRLRDSWYTAAPLRFARRNNAGIVMDNALYCVGGFDGNDVLATVERLDPRMKNWSLVAPLTSPRSSCMLAQQNGYIYAMGGTCGERLNTIERYNVRADRWETTPTSLPQVTSAGAACTFQNEVYLCGGMDNAHCIHSSMLHLDSETQAISSCTGLANGIADAALVSNGKVMYLTGGQSDHVSNECYLYKPQVDQWQDAPPLITSRCGHCLVVLDF
ncbi:bifunctional Kelch-type beta propeller/Kelch repeat type 1/SKP1-BTB-POZ domain superfamily/Potassium channel tetramerization-type BTB domain/BTB-POZ domain [Babesia duncani]|uniref:Bifunctional Kelch-type beta propeller/Kelch repeat type 1/SKP1-BTB-POZ domain superfamily/Potassium channel tetramerization-type BTB domain/BTB-POZ domain n=1 Tax=Babesia duncani TaxID=323732 RepID=A0AAD9PM63_9APIC|nr:bifunctional Kelch-type beta propeller/Kelch repeat type 1/SKP1-BTB-POZ domain superfamily/Potassium channel tetramerization-type BTB domain/BTB-POZ domain [Babesia duncani]